MLHCRCLPGKVWEILLGHMTFASLLRRDVLSCFFALHRFVRASNTAAAPLWRSARQEVEAFVDLMPLIEAKLARPWSDLIGAADASETGYGVCLARWEHGQSGAAGRTSERSRFRKKEVVGVRSLFMEQHSVFIDEAGCLGDLGVVGVDGGPLAE